MATSTSNTLDAHSLTTWEDAFTGHAIPAVRTLERQLRRTEEENRQKLRSLVGASYRDLLGTAERIIAMDDQIRAAEGHLADVARRCNTRVLERITGNEGRLRAVRRGDGLIGGSGDGKMKKEKRAGEDEDEESDEGDQESTEAARARIVAPTKVLQSALAVTNRIIRTKGDALLASKLLVLARLLHKSVSEAADPPPVLEELARRARRARRRLLAYIAHALGHADHNDRAATLQTLCAYALLASAAPRGVLRYFLQVRFAQLETRTEAAGAATADPSEDLLAAVDLVRRTLSDTRELFPRRFAEALGQVSQAALVRDPSVRAVAELNLDLHEQWIAADVRRFMPWTQHEPVAASEVKDAVASWTRQAQACLLQGLTEALETQEDPARVLALRQKVLSKYLALSVRFRDGSHTRAIGDLRAAFLTRLEQLVEGAAKIDTLDLDKEVTATRKGEGEDLWNLATQKVELGRGATQLRQAVLRSQHGRTDAVVHVTSLLDRWIERLGNSSEIVTSLKGTKWDDDIELDLDELEDGEEILASLGKNDPQQLEKKLQSCAQATLRATYATLQKYATKEDESDKLGAVAAFHLRLFRELDLRRGRLSGRFADLAAVAADPDTITTLQKRVVLAATSDVTQQYVRRSQAPGARAATAAVVALWDGTPPLPVLPSPSAFRFLTSLHRQMSAAGVDIWSPEAVRNLKAYVATALEKGDVFDIPTFEPVVAAGKDPKEDSKTEQNGEATAEATSQESEKEAAVKVQSSAGDEETQRRNHKNFLLQLTFDALYLQNALAVTKGSSDKNSNDHLQQPITALWEHLEVEAVARERLRKSALDYWRRTHLLFGLLAGSGS